MLQRPGYEERVEPRGGRQFLAVAVPASDDLERRLAQCRAAWTGPGTAPRFVSPSQLHLTLRFLGDVDPEQEATLHHSLTALDVPTMELAVDGSLGVFSGVSRARVLWARVGGNGVRALHELARALETLVRTAGFAPEPKPFRPHVTLARWRGRPASAEVVRDYLQRARFGSEPLQWTARELLRYRSELQPDGARYQVLARYGS